MAMSQKSRTTIYQALEPMIGEVATEEMLAHFPARDLGQPVTVAHLHAEVAGLRTEMAGLRAEIHDGHRRIVMWLVGTQAAFLAAVLAFAR